MINRVHIILFISFLFLGFSVKAQNVGFVTGDTDYQWVKINYSSANDTTITVVLKRTANVTTQLKVNFETEEQALNNRITGAKPDLNPNIFKFAKSIPAQYVEFPLRDRKSVV